MNHLRFFFGTPARALWTFGVGVGIALTLVLIHILWPGAIANAIYGTVREFTPLFDAVIVLAITVFGFRLMFRGTRDHGGGRRN